MSVTKVLLNQIVELGLDCSYNYAWRISNAGDLVSIPSPATGMIAYYITGSTVVRYYYNGVAWVQVTSMIAGNVIPTGAIMMWSGTLATIPSGWALCDGTNGTPNLIDRFIKSVSAAENPGATGGSTSYTPTGLVSAPTFTGDSVSTSAVSAGTPAGSVSAPTFTGNAVTSTAVSAGTPAGTNSAPVFTGSALGTHTHGVGSYANTAISAGTPAGTNSWPAGVPTHSGTAASFTGNAVAAASTNATPDLVTSNTTGTGVSPVTTATGTVTITNQGTIAWPAGVPTFAGSALATHNHTFSGSSEAVSAGTPSGSVAAPVFTGSALGTHTHDTTATGTNSAPTFTGSALGTHQHTVTATGTNSAPTFTGDAATIQPPYYKLAYIMKL